MRPSLLGLSLATLALAACNPFHRDPVTEVTRDVNANARWTAAMVTPAALSGAVQVRGNASMQPSSNSGRTDVLLNLSNATPGGRHPWQVRRGRCGSDYGTFGSAGSYNAIHINDDGNGKADSTIDERTPDSGDYSVVVYASAENQTVLACGNLAAPAR